MGVCKETYRSGNVKWRARLYLNGQCTNIGMFKTKAEAQLALALRDPRSKIHIQSTPIDVHAFSGGLAERVPLWVRIKSHFGRSL